MARRRHLVLASVLGLVRALPANADTLGSSVCAVVGADEAVGTQCSNTPPYGQTSGATVSLEGRTVLPGNSNGDPIFGPNIGVAKAVATVDASGLHVLASATSTNPNASLAGPAYISAQANASFTTALTINVVLATAFETQYGLTGTLPPGFKTGDSVPLGDFELGPIAALLRPNLPVSGAVY